MQKDGDGFVSRLAPDGEILDQHWIHGGRNGVELHAPMGMVIAGDTLWIADVDEVRAFDRRSGAPLESIQVPEATFLVDVAASPDGRVYVTNVDLEDVEGSAIHRILPGGGTELVARGAELDYPTALVAIAEDELLTVTNRARIRRRGRGESPSPWS